MKTVAAVALAACVLGQALPASAGWFLDADVNAVHETNVGLAQKARDVRGDTALTTGLSGGYAFTLGDRHTLSLAGDAEGSAHIDVPGLNHVGVGTTAAFRTKFGLGASAPWLRLFASGARLEVDDTVRDGWRYRLGAGGGIRVSERWAFGVDYVFEERIADHARAINRTLPGDVFDLTSHTYSVRADYFHDDVFAVFVGYALRDGDVVSTTRRNAEILAASSALTLDRAFGSEFVAYKIDATVHILSFGLSFALGPHASLNFGYERHIGLGRRGLDYFNDVFRGGVLLSF